MTCVELPDLTVFNSYKAADKTTADHSHVIGSIRLFYSDIGTVQMYQYANYADNPPIPRGGWGGC